MTIEEARVRVAEQTDPEIYDIASARANPRVSGAFAIPLSDSPLSLFYVYGSQVIAVFLADPGNLGLSID